jgi:uncharacterized protein YbaP (TraB family)
MTHLFRLLLASISVSLVLPVPATAQSLAQQTSEPNAETATPQGGVFTKGLLWKIEAPESSSTADAPDYLFGTMHSDDPQITTVLEKVQHALTASDSFCMEMVPDTAALMIMSKSMVFTNGKTLQAVIGDQLFKQLTPLMMKRGIPAQALAMFKPWAVFLTLSVPPQKTGMFLDLVLYEKAKQQHKMLCGLETAEEQVIVFEETSLEDQILLLQQIVKDPHAPDKQLAQLTEKYLARDLMGLIDLSHEFDDATPREQKSAAAFLRRLIDDRNVRMVERMLPRLERGATFIAIGALHLPGEKGILQLLTERGYTVSVVY